jgi:hypothetical protein
VACVVLAATCSATAAGATKPMTACDRTNDLQSLQVPASELSSNMVGHIVTTAAEGKGESPHSLPAQAESAAPMLYLAPRVKAILKDVFSAVAIETPPSDSSDHAPHFTIDSAPKNESPLSPVANDADQPDSPELNDQDLDTVPNFQRQMFRTDI